MKSGIDEIRTDLEWLDAKAAPDKGCDERRCDRCLANTAVRACNYKPWDVHY
jgi:hypothetical protein